jgi:hypothetical protein
MTETTVPFFPFESLPRNPSWTPATSDSAAWFAGSLSSLGGLSDTASKAFMRRFRFTFNGSITKVVVDIK